MSRSKNFFALAVLVSAILTGCATMPSHQPQTAAAVSSDRLGTLNARLAEQSDEAQRGTAQATAPDGSVAVVNQRTGGSQAAAGGGFQAARAGLGGSPSPADTLLQRLQAQDQLQKVLRQSQSGAANSAVAVRTAQTPTAPQVKAATF